MCLETPHTRLCAQGDPHARPLKRHKAYTYKGPTPSVEEVEGEFWRVVEQPDGTLESLYGQDIDSGHHGSGFPLPPFRLRMLEQRLREGAVQGAAASAKHAAKAASEEAVAMAAALQQRRQQQPQPFASEQQQLPSATTPPQGDEPAPTAASAAPAALEAATLAAGSRAPPAAQQPSAAGEGSQPAAQQPAAAAGATTAPPAEQQGGAGQQQPAAQQRQKRRTPAAAARDAEERRWRYHRWNINNLPRSAGSVLRHVVSEELVTGVMVPWLYIGSALSAFCWHIEDHGFYSINYLHMGAPKIWCVTGARAILCRFGSATQLRRCVAPDRRSRAQGSHCMPEGRCCRSAPRPLPHKHTARTLDSERL